MRFRSFAVVGIVSVACISVTREARAGLLADYNLIVLQNLNSTSEVEGRTFVGGDSSGGNYAIKLDPTAYKNTKTLVVGGNVSSFNLNAGGLLYGGSISGNQNNNGGGAFTHDSTVSNQVAGDATQLKADSAYYSGLTTNSSLILPDPAHLPGPLTFNANPNSAGLAVFSVDASIFSNSSYQQVNLNLNGAKDIVINVTGSPTVAINGANFVGHWTDPAVRATTLWNFAGATSIDVQRNFDGALLAPLASLTSNTAIDGSVFVNSFTQNGEVHLPYPSLSSDAANSGGTPSARTNYAGVVPNGAPPAQAVPEPATLAACGFGALIALVASRRRKAA